MLYLFCDYSFNIDDILAKKGAAPVGFKIVGPFVQIKSFYSLYLQTEIVKLRSDVL
ncbi:hypothetical protein SAMN05421827_101264 [Pedobacter terrae]|uniref:Uncharacterized protein n=1 Tax=Pedobacter terrae TaxID=405671 RepID=A0A1G7N9M1_9SPHI|nr:hypothetical protein SAMN05421827_101264 [Pedobacter terrae]